MNALRRAGIGLVAAGAASVVMAVPALAAPTNAPDAVTVTATCNGMHLTLVHNAANGNGQGTMNNPSGQAVFAPAHVVGSNEVFVPTKLDLTFTFTPAGGGPPVAFVEQAMKNQSASVECDNVSGSITNPQGTTEISGTVWGNFHGG
jgi:hypothetical protein